MTPNECTSTKCDLKFSKLLAWSTTKKPVYLRYGMHFFMYILPCNLGFSSLSSFTIQGRRKVWKSGVPILFGGHNLPPLVEIRLTDLPKSAQACNLSWGSVLILYPTLSIHSNIRILCLERGTFRRLGICFPCFTC